MGGFEIEGIEEIYPSFISMSGDNRTVVVWIHRSFTPFPRGGISRSVKQPGKKTWIIYPRVQYLRNLVGVAWLAGSAASRAFDPRQSGSDGCLEDDSTSSTTSFFHSRENGCFAFL